VLARAKQSRVVCRRRTGLIAGEKRRADLDALCTKRQRGNHPSSIGNTARRDHRHPDVIDDLRDERKGADQRLLGWTKKGCPVATCFKA
jgi:hypothetical protein